MKTCINPSPKNNQAYIFYLLLGAIITFTSCGSSSEIEEIEEIDFSPASNVTVFDISNNGNGSDVNVIFKKASKEDLIQEYRVLVVKDILADSYSLENAKTVIIDNYTSLSKTGGDHSVTLSAEATDTDGEPIVEQVSYSIFVLSVAINDEQTEMTRSLMPIILETTNIVEVVLELPIGPGGISIDQQGNVFISDNRNASEGGDLLYKIDQQDKASIFATGFTGASGNTIGADGNIYQSNISTGVVNKITQDGFVSVYSTELGAPIGIAFDSEGNLFTTDCGNQNIRIVGPDGGLGNVFATDFICPYGIAIDEDDNLYITDFGNSDIIKITKDGERSTFATLPGTRNGHITLHNDNFYISSISTNQIYKVSLEDASIALIAGTGIAGHSYGAALKSQFSSPNGIAVSNDGNTIYVNDIVPIGTNAESPSFVKRIHLVLQGD